MIIRSKKSKGALKDSIIRSKELLKRLLSRNQDCERFLNSQRTCRSEPKKRLRPIYENFVISKFY